MRIGEELGRRADLESMAKKYPDAPMEAIIQDDLLRCGVAFTESALRILEQYATKTYNLFTFDFQATEDVPDRAFIRVPDQLHYTGGIYALRGNVTADVHQNSKSGYVIDVIDEKLKLCGRENGLHVPIADVIDPYPVPKYREKAFDDGVKYSEIVDAVPGKSFSRLTPFRMCQYWAKKEQCKFCDINAAAKVQKNIGLRHSKTWTEDVDRVREVMEEIYLKEEWPVGKKPRSIMITGGSILTQVNGLNEDDFYLRYVEAIKDAIGNRWPLCLQTAPKPKEIAKRYKAAGVDVHETNLEVWDEGLFKVLCPGKEKHIGREQWIKLMIDEVDVFGEGNVTPCFVEGVEMCQPWGFKTIDEAIKSTAEGYEFLMSHGVIPRPNLWVASASSALKGNTVPPLEFFVRLGLTWYELWKKYTLPPPRRFNLVGPGREQAERGWVSMGY
jgi:hypothetical protein